MVDSPAMETERIYIDKLANGMAIDQVFLVRDKDLRTTRNGGLYIQCTLCDKSGSVSGRLWQATDAIYASIPAGGFVHVKGRTEDYRGMLQFIIEALRPVPTENVDLADFLATSPYDIEEMWAEALDILRQVKNPHLRMLIKKFVEDRELVARVKRSPAAMTMHHPYIGGLVEHTLNMMRSAQAVLPLYPKLNADLVYVGIFLHDLGKCSELSADIAIDYTERGNLIGHITETAIWIGEKAAAVAAETAEPFPARTVMLLQHIVLSHHGVHEYGSPKLPMIPEAFLIHYLDNMDAKMYMTFNDIERDPDPSSPFAPYNRALEGRMYKHSGTLE